MKLTGSQLDTKADLLDITSPVSKFYRAYSDFIYNNTGDFVGTASGSGVITYGIVDDSNHPGIISLSAVSSGNHTRVGYGTSATILLLGNGEVKYETMILLPILSDATETFNIQCGFLDNVSAVDGCYFRYQHAENGGRWQACTRTNNGTVNSVNTGVTVAASTWYKLMIIINSDATSARFFINNVLVATITTSIPSGTGRQTAIATWISKTLGNTSRVMWVDYMEIVGQCPNR